MQYRSWILFALTLFSTGAMHGQPWAGILSPSRAVDWRNAGVVGGIPSQSWGQCSTAACNTVISAGASVTAAQINSALASAPDHTFVFLPAGTYHLSDTFIQINRSNVALRGAGADQTKIINSYANAACNPGPASICVQGSNSDPTNTPNHANWTSGYSHGATSITLDNIGNMAVGSDISLDQCDDGFTGNPCSGSAVDTGAYFNCATIGVCTSQGPGGVQRSNRSQIQMVQVTSISGSGPYTIGISPGLYNLNWRTGQTPGASWATKQISYSGVENLSVDDSGVNGGTNGVELFNCNSCWIIGTRTIDTGRAHIQLHQATHATVMSNYGYKTQNASSTSYGIETYLSSDSLIVNNIMEHVVSPTISGGPDEGNVVAYNFAVDDFYNAPGWFQPSHYIHASGSGPYVLMEGNQYNGFEADNRHGTHNVMTTFRNLFSGRQASCDGTACSNPTIPLYIQEFNRYFNYIGNVLGTPGYHNTYSNFPSTTTSSNTTNCQTTIMTIGYGGTCLYDSSKGLDDPYSSRSAMFWGQYDVATASVRWNGSEVPSGLTDGYANPVPSSQTLPASFVYSSKPSFWSDGIGGSNIPWPAIGPDVTGGTIPGYAGHVYNNPAALCYMNSPVDSTYQTSYNVTNATWSNGIATVTIGSSVIQGEVRITGVTPAGYNVPNGVQITASTSTTVSYPVATNPGAFSGGGTLKWPNVRAFNANNCFSSGSSQDPPPPAPTGLNITGN